MTGHRSDMPVCLPSATCLTVPAEVTVIGHSQSFDQANSISCSCCGTTLCACAGGLNNKQMHQELARGVDIITGTPCKQAPQDSA